MNNVIKAVADQIREIKDQQGYTQSEMASLIGVSNPYLSYLLKGRNITLKTLEKVAHALGKEVVIEFREVQAVRRSRGSKEHSTDAA